MRLLIATSNLGKAQEYAAALGKAGFEAVPLAEFDSLMPPPENASTFAGNARLKAEYYFARLGLPALADDSGLMVDALQGAPGVLSARWGSNDRQRISQVLRRLAEIEARKGPVDRRACFQCAICLKTPDHLYQAQGEVEGKIIDSPRGSHGFGYDPIFLYPPLGKTFAEIDRETKNRLSHRARALDDLLQQLPPGRADLKS